MSKPHIKPYKELHAIIMLHDETDTSIAAKVGLSQQQMSSRMQDFVCLMLTKWQESVKN